jgi:hypothetical protein
MGPCQSKKLSCHPAGQLLAFVWGTLHCGIVVSFVIFNTKKGQSGLMSNG